MQYGGQHLAAPPPPPPPPPPRPVVSNVNVPQLVDITGVTEAQARTLLKKCNNDLNNAINSYFEDPVNSVRDVPPPNEWQYQDNVPFSDESGGLPAMSRPPSRVDNKSNRMGAEHGPAIQLQEIKDSDEIDDPDLQRAMAMSLSENLPKQESGVTSKESHFGPATREHYDPSKWALAPVTSSREVFDHPPPEKRQRLPDEPAFLRGAKSTEYLGPLLTILHGIPLAREALLLPSMNITGYGYDPTWWSGTSDENSKSISVEEEYEGDRNRHNFLAEVQCLMAFLDSTNRAYGTVDALDDLRALKEYRAETEFSRFLEAWKNNALMQSPSDQLTQLFSSIAMKAQDGSEAASVEEKALVCLEPPVNRIEGQLLVDLLDGTVWNDVADNLDDVWIQNCAEVFTMRLHDPGKAEGGLAITVPSVWYPDRYLYECRTTSQQMRLEMQAIRKEMVEFSKIQTGYEVITTPDRRVLNVRDILSAAATAPIRSPFSKSSLLNGSRDLQSSTLEINEDNVEKELQNTLKRIEAKLKLLDQRKQELQKQMRQITLQLTEPSADPSQPPHHRYVLQGVSTKTDVTYLRRPNQDLLQLDNDSNDGSTSDSQWWRIAWTGELKGAPKTVYQGPLTQVDATRHVDGQTASAAPNLNPSASDRPFEIGKVDEADVIEAVRSEHHTVVLVYANDNAMTFKGSPLTPALRQFIEQDNRVFDREIRSNTFQTDFDMNRGSSGTSFENVLLNGQGDEEDLLRDSTPMSVSSVHRDSDGQPSPKRPRSADDYVYDGQTSPRDLPPPYEDSHNPFDAREPPSNKIGLYADQMLKKYEGAGALSQPILEHNEEGPVHIEYARDLPR